MLKKRLALGPVLSVTCEILLFLPLALTLLALAHGSGQGAFGTNPHDTVLLMLSGPITALPLILFSAAARRVAMATVGLLQYINPTLQFLCAVVIFAEPFTAWHALAFPLICVALVLYSVAAIRQDRAARRAAIAVPGVSTTLR
jgi:chloramphenicol-sensitive protein RarD